MPRKEETDKKQVQDIFSEKRLNRKIRRALVGLEPAFESKTLGDEISGVVNRIIQDERDKIERLVWRVANEATKQRGFADKLKRQINNPAPRISREELREKLEKEFEERKKEEPKNEPEKIATPPRKPMTETPLKAELRTGRPAPLERVLTEREKQKKRERDEYNREMEKRSMMAEEERTRTIEKNRRDRKKIREAIEKATPENAEDIKVLSELKKIQETGKIRISYKTSKGRKVVKNVKVDL